MSRGSSTLHLTIRESPRSGLLNGRLSELLLCLYLAAANLVAIRPRTTVNERSPLTYYRLTHSVPDTDVAVIANGFVIHQVDLDDKEKFMGSKNLFEVTHCCQCASIGLHYDAPPFTKSRALMCSRLPSGLTCGIQRRVSLGNRVQVLSSSSLKPFVILNSGCANVWQANLILHACTACPLARTMRPTSRGAARYLLGLVALGRSESSGLTIRSPTSHRRVWRLYDLMAPSMQLPGHLPTAKLPFSVKVDQSLGASLWVHPLMLLPSVTSTAGPSNLRSRRDDDAARPFRGYTLRSHQGRSGCVHRSPSLVIPFDV